MPIVTSNDDYNKNGSAPPEEKAERVRIARDSKLVETKQLATVTPDSGAADVVAYIVAGDGRVDSTLRLMELSRADDVAEFLEKAVRKMNIPRGEHPLIETRPTMERPRAKPDAMTLLLTTRYVTANGKKRPPVSSGAVAFERWMALIANRLRAVCLLPAESWITLEHAEWTKLRAPDDAKVGASWDLTKDVGAKLFKNFYPPSTNNDPAQHRIEQLSLKATLVSIEDGMARVRLDGAVKAKHPFLLFEDDDFYVEATVRGYVDYEVKSKRMPVVRLATVKGTYASGDFGAVVRSVENTNNEDVPADTSNLIPTATASWTWFVFGSALLALPGIFLMLRLRNQKKVLLN